MHAANSKVHLNYAYIDQLAFLILVKSISLPSPFLTHLHSVNTMYSHRLNTSPQGFGTTPQREFKPVALLDPEARAPRVFPRELMIRHAMHSERRRMYALSALARCGVCHISRPLRIQHRPAVASRFRADFSFIARHLRANIASAQELLADAGSAISRAASTLSAARVHNRRLGAR